MLNKVLLILTKYRSVNMTHPKDILFGRLFRGAEMIQLITVFYRCKKVKGLMVFN